MQKISSEKFRQIMVAIETILEDHEIEDIDLDTGEDLSRPEGVCIFLPFNVEDD